MARILAIYKTPADKAAFDKYYFEKHVPLAKTMDEQINTLREWAEGRARNASVPRDFQTDTFRRNIDATNRS